MNYTDIVTFHGHDCPGLAIGYRMTQAAMNQLQSIRAEDEELVAIVENKACGVDAVQCLTGCTFGKGNLIFHDYGKHVYTLYSRETGQGVRVVFHGRGIPANLREDRLGFVRWLLAASDHDIVSVTPVTIDEPRTATIRKSVRCSICGETVMETRVHHHNGQSICIPCSNIKKSPD